jgi:prepilin-type N-terminal cleavage/methylation domain-containing protein
MSRFFESDDSGFTLAEVMVVLLILGVVITAMYAGLQVAQGGVEIATREGQMQQEIGFPLHIMDKWLSQNQVIEFGDGYTLVFHSPTDALTHTYRRYVIGTDGTGKLTDTVDLIDISTGTVTRQSKGTWSRTNQNRALSKPLFTYYDESGVTTTTVAAARAVSVEIWSKTDGRLISGKRHIYFRNR